MSNPISGTSDQTLYQSQKYACNGPLDLSFSVPNGTYQVTLKFAEIYFGNPGQRVFSAALNGQTVLSGFDILAAAGGELRAVDQTFTATVTNGSAADGPSFCAPPPPPEAALVVRGGR